jgi:hypothetical protein
MRHPTVLAPPGYAKPVDPTSPYVDLTREKSGVGQEGVEGDSMRFVITWRGRGRASGGRDGSAWTSPPPAHTPPSTGSPPGPTQRGEACLPPRAGFPQA